MARLSYKESVLGALRTLSDGQDRLILNSQIYEKLGWPRAKFLKVRDQLYSDGLLTYEGHYTKFVDFKRDGRERAKCKLFISYAHSDEKLKDELLKHLSPLSHLNLIDTWHDRKMRAGDHIDDEISKELRESDLILLLVSADFLASEYCYHREMVEAVSRHNAKETVVVPVILRHCLWTEAPFGKLLAATKDGKPLTAYSTLDEGLLEVVKSIRLRLKS